MNRRVLVAGVGNVFFGDDGFGVAVAHRLQRDAFPDSVAIVDFGIRALHLAFELLATPAIDLLVLVDATARGGEPGTLYVIDPERNPEALAGMAPDAHAISPFTVLAMLQSMGGTLPMRTRIIGCEPAQLDGGIGLSEMVQEAIEPAACLVRRLIEGEVTHAVANEQAQ
jgi:hydrogenase maturation protease